MNIIEFKPESVSANGRAAGCPVQPMLAERFDHWFDQVTFPCFSQPKLNGLRCLADRNGLWSRPDGGQISGRRFSTLTHIELALREFFSKHPTAILDGELYRHEWKLGAIGGAIRSGKSSDEIRLHIFDAVQIGGARSPRSLARLAESAERGGAGDFTERRQALLAALPTLNRRSGAERGNNAIRLVPTEPVSDNNHLDAIYSRYLASGFEGQMIRWGNFQYQPRRSKFLLKRKPIQN
jgi:ATP-dependent DNA ligase